MLLAAAVIGCGETCDSSARPAPTGSAVVSASPSPTATPIADAGDPLSGGATTVFTATRDAFGQPARNLPLAERTAFFVGNALFNRTWVAAPSSTVGSDGLGPVFNAPSCSSCHLRDGRGRPPLEPSEPFVGLLVRLSIPGTAADGGPLPEPRYGDQLSHRAIPGVPPEGQPAVTYGERDGTYGDGEPFALLVPVYSFSALAFGPLDPAVQISPRVAPAIIGLGLLAAIDDAEVLARADPDDVDGDGISGRPNWVWDRRRHTTVLGRFGWKANQPNLEQQNAAAFLGDIGLTSPLFAEENCTPVQLACAAAPSGGTPELDQEKLDVVTFYTRYLAVPARRDVADPAVREGEALFSAIGCAACHTPAAVTGAVPDAPALAGQRVHPYTDLLLHDMGEDLADGRPDFDADGREWRTPPLWGIGLVTVVNRHTRFLHDGRARDLAEAILWHGGEATAARERFRLLPAGDRAALVRFLESL